MKYICNDAVSPVIGVLLMLVVTIIIAAIVSAFAGGLSSDESKAPQASLEARVLIENITGTWHFTNPPTYPAGFEARNGIQFEHKGGDPFSLNDITIQLENQGVTMISSAGDKLPSSTCLPSGITDGGYFVKVGSTTSDKIIESGDKFMFYADNCYRDDGKEFLLWTFERGYGYGTVGDFYKYKIIDQRSSKPISAGEFLLK